MSKRIITISREFGSGGRFIGEETARKLGIAYYDKEIITQIAENSGLSSEFIAEKAELSPKKGFFSYAFIGRDMYHVNESEAMKMMQDVDKRRSVNYNFYTDQTWGMASNYTLALNSSELGYEMCEKMIIDCVKE